GGDIGAVVHVELADLDLAGKLGSQLVHGGPELAAGAAPRRPEIDHHRLLAAGDFGVPVVAGELQDVLTGHEFSPFWLSRSGCRRTVSDRSGAAGPPGLCSILGEPFHSSNAGPPGSRLALLPYLEGARVWKDSGK